MFCTFVMAGGSGFIRASSNKARGKCRRAAPRRELAPKVDSQHIFSSYVGQNTPGRKDYIRENLSVPVEE